MWHVRATLHVLSQNGSLLTCSSISLLAALLHFRIPASEVRGGQLTVFNVLQRDPVPLALLHHPVCLTMACFPADGDVESLIDPILVEEQVSTGEIVVGGNKEGEVLLIEKNGGTAVEGAVLMKYVESAVQKT